MNTLGLNPQNKIINDNLVAAMSALVHLNDHGCTVLSIEIGTRKPVITIDGPNGPFLQGSQRMRFRDAVGHRVIMVATVNGCQVEWKETYRLPSEVANG